MKVYSEDNVAVRKVSIQRLKKYSVSAAKWYSCFFNLIMKTYWCLKIGYVRFNNTGPWIPEKENNLLAIWYCLWINCFDRIFQERKMGKRSRFLVSFVKMNWKIIQNNPKFLPISSLLRLINIIRYLRFVFEFSH